MEKPKAELFPNTHVSAVVKAGQGAAPALSELCKSYWRPLYVVARSRGYSAEEASDLTQGFLTGLLAPDNKDGDKKTGFARFDQNRGRFRG